VRRGIHIAIAILAILLLAKPFDCFAGGAWTQKAADCCHKGKCTPGPKADECCRASVPEGNQFLASKAANDAAPAIDLVSTTGPALNITLFSGDALFIVHSPLGSPPDSQFDLPLLV
jgi:hypothetical protein